MKQDVQVLCTKCFSFCKTCCCGFFVCLFLFFLPFTVSVSTQEKFSDSFFFFLFLKATMVPGESVAILVYCKCGLALEKRLSG